MALVWPYSRDMKTQRTHLLALRAASQVTAVSRAFRRVAVGTAASALLLTSTPGCATDSDPGSSVDAATAESDVSTRADVSSLMDTILGNDSQSTTTDVGTSDGADGSDLTDVVSGVDTDGADMTDSADATDLADVISREDTGGADMMDAADMTDAADMSDGADMTDGVDTTDDADVMVADAASPDTSELPETCLIPNGKACATDEDCNGPDMWGQVCVDAECHDSDFTSDEVAECCSKQYEAGNFGVPGCNPWGPPAPPADRGYRLSELTAALGIA